MNECFNSHSRIFETDLFTLVKKRTNFMEYSRSYMKTAKHTVDASNALFFPSHSSFSNHIIVYVSPSAVTHSLTHGVLTVSNSHITSLPFNRIFLIQWYCICHQQSYSTGSFSPTPFRQVQYHLSVLKSSMVLQFLPLMVELATIQLALLCQQMWKWVFMEQKVPALWGLLMRNRAPPPLLLWLLAGPTGKTLSITSKNTQVAGISKTAITGL